MRFSLEVLVALLALVSTSVASPVVNLDEKRDVAPDLRGKTSFVKRDGVERTIFEHEATGATLDYVTNSGICETTKGVNQYSGYISVGPNENYFFWFFEARHHASKAPLAVWFNGGPGCSSLIGLFQENGPCQFYNNSSEPSLNPYSWNEYTNLLYIDQPVGVGFSYGDHNANSTYEAAPFVWKFFQSFYAHFPQYETRDFGLFTESYGGHYGPEFTYYFEQQNALITSGTLSALPISLIALGINNGWYSALIQEKASIDFGYNNTWHPWLSASDHAYYLNAYYTECQPLIEKCELTGTDADCTAARNGCLIIDKNMDSINFDPYDVREPVDDPYPPATFETYLARPDIVKRIGAKSNYSECSDSVGGEFVPSADDVRTFLPELSSVVQSGVQTVIWAGDADAVCDWFGGFASVNAINYTHAAEFVSKEVKNYTVKGEVGGTYKNVGSLSWLRVFASGHEVPYYQPELALQVFKQTMKKKGLHGT